MSDSSISNNHIRWICVTVFLIVLVAISIWGEETRIFASPAEQISSATPNPSEELKGRDLAQSALDAMARHERALAITLALETVDLAESSPGVQQVLVDIAAQPGLVRQLVGHQQPITFFGCFTRREADH